MPYVKRSVSGQIEAVSAVIAEGFSEFVEPGAQELVSFFSAQSKSFEKKPEVNSLSVTDSDVARIFEDLVDVLISKGVIQFTDFPQAAQQKLMKRQSLRREFTGLRLDTDYNDSTINLD